MVLPYDMTRDFRETAEVFVISDLIRIDPVFMEPVPVKMGVFSNKGSNRHPDRTPGLYKY